jgi:hypothetical protein
MRPILTPEQHHPDCDYRNSSAAVEADETFGVPEGEQPNEAADCNLNCEQDALCDLIAKVREKVEEARSVWDNDGDDVDLALTNVLTALNWAEDA